MFFILSAFSIYCLKANRVVMLDNAPGGPLQNWKIYLREALFSGNRGGSCPLASLPQATSLDPQLNFPQSAFSF